MRQIHTSNFPVYDHDDLVALDETQLSRAFCRALEKGHNEMTLKMSDGKTIVMDLRKENLSDRLICRQGVMVSKKSGAFVLEAVSGSDHQGLAHELCVRCRLAAE